MKEQIELLVKCFEELDNKYFDLLDKVVELSSSSDAYRPIKDEMEFLKGLKKYLRIELSAQFKEVDIDPDLVDEIHDEILGYDDEDYECNLPNGYEVHILDSEYIVAYGWYKTYCLIKTNEGQYKPISVNTFSKYRKGEIIE